MKPDKAHVWTDEQLKELEKRIAAEYKKAADELGGKISAYFASFAKRDEAQKALIGTAVNGREYTEQDYKQWRLAQMGRGKRFEALRDRLAAAGVTNCSLSNFDAVCEIAAAEGKIKLIPSQALSIKREDFWTASILSRLTNIPSAA